MSKANHKGRAKGGEKHVRLHAWLLNSTAYRSLSPLARCLLVELYFVYNGSNNGDVFLSCRDAAAALGLHSKNAAARAFAELERNGFIKPRTLGAFTRKSKIATTWILTEYGVDGREPTKDFMRWQPGKDFRAQRPASKKQNTVLVEGLTVLVEGPVSLQEDRGVASQSSQEDRHTPKPPVLSPPRGTHIVCQEGGAAIPTAQPPLLGRKSPEAGADLINAMTQRYGIKDRVARQAVALNPETAKALVTGGFDAAALDAAFPVFTLRIAEKAA